MKKVYEDENVQLIIDNIVNGLEAIDKIEYCVIRNSSINVVFDEQYSDAYKVRNEVSRAVVSQINKVLPMNMYIDEDRYIIRITIGDSDVESYLTCLTGLLEFNDKQTEKVYSKLRNFNSSYENKILAASLCYNTVSTNESSEIWNLFDRRKIENCTSELF